MSYVAARQFFLGSQSLIAYNRDSIEEIRITVGFGEEVMRNFYDNVWLPFTANKRRILILVIATYIALC